jgi:hypothetical protein
MQFGFPIRLPGFRRPAANMEDFVGSDFPTFAMLHTLFHPAILETFEGRIGWLPATISCVYADPFADPNGFRCIIVHRKQIMRLTTHLYKKKVIQAWSIDSLQKQSGSWKPSDCKTESELAPIIRLWGLEAENEMSFVFVPIEFVLFVKPWCVQGNKLLSLRETCALRNIKPPKDLHLGERKLKLSHFHIKNYSHTRGLLGKNLEPETVARFRVAMEVIRGESLPTNMHMCGMLGLPEQERFLKPRKNAAIKSTARRVNHVHLFTTQDFTSKVDESIKAEVIVPSESRPIIKRELPLLETIPEPLVPLKLEVAEPVKTFKPWECEWLVLDLVAHSRPARVMREDFANFLG